MIAEPGRYSKVIEVMAALRSAKIECGETPGGGVRICPDNDGQADVARKICGDMGVHVHDGDRTNEMDFRDAMRQERQSFGPGIPGLAEEEPGAPAP